MKAQQKFGGTKPKDNSVPARQAMDQVNKAKNKVHKIDMSKTTLQGRTKAC